MSARPAPPLLALAPRQAFRRSPAETLAERAARLWPDDLPLQAEWMRAVRLVRATRRGWLLERRDA